MKNDARPYFSRLHLRPVFLALAAFPVIASAQVDPYSLISGNQTISNQLGSNAQVWEVVSGNRHQFGGGQVVPAGASTPTGGSTMSGAGTVKPHEPLNLSGWQRAGNFGVASDATGVTVGSTVKVDKFGTMRPPSPVAMTLKSKITAANVARGVVAGARVLTPIGGAILVGSAIEIYLREAGYQNVRRGADGELQADELGSGQSQGLCNGQLPNEWGTNWYNTSMAPFAAAQGWSKGSLEIIDEGSTAKCRQNVMKNGTVYNYGTASFTCPPGTVRSGISCTGGSTVEPVFETAMLQKLTQMAGDSAHTGDPIKGDKLKRAIAEAVSKGVNIPTQEPTISGASQVSSAPRTETSTQSPTQTSGQPQTNTQTQTQTKTITDTAKITYAGNSYTYNITTNTTTNSTTNTTNNETNTTTTTTTTTTEETEKPEEDPKDPCTENPDRIGCAKFGTPENQQINRDNKSINIEPVQIGGAGQCPTPLTGQVQVGSFVKSYEISYQPACDAMGIIRPIVLMFAGVIAAYVFAGGFRV